jgi:predicted enzyme related to lactoylglutathione lyase
MRKMLILVFGLSLFVAFGCAPKNISKADTSVAEQFKTHGMVSWYELMTTDVEASKKFYSELFDWAAEDVRVGGMPYSIVKVNGKELGGMMAMPPEAKGIPPHWGIYVTVDDVDATAGLAEKLGAKILVSPRDIPDVGRFCVIKDPQGAVISVMTHKMK